MGKSIFEDLSKINVNDKVEKKSNGQVELTYLSWCYAVSEITKRYPNMQYEIRHWDGKPYLHDENLGYMVETSVHIEDQTKTMWLPVMDGANRAMKAQPYTVQTRYKEVTVQPATMMDINKAIMRCLVKNFAMFGLGIYIYAGEDLPEGEETKISVPMQEVFKKKYIGENMEKLLKANNLEKLEDMPMKTGIELINKLKGGK